VAERLREPVARVLDNAKQQQLRLLTRPESQDRGQAVTYARLIAKHCARYTRLERCHG
jgi:hypothetical protein